MKKTICDADAARELFMYTVDKQPLYKDICCVLKCLYRKAMKGSITLIRRPTLSPVSSRVLQSCIRQSLAAAVITLPLTGQLVKKPVA